MKRSAPKRGQPPKRSAPPKRGGRPQPKKRSASEYARIYGSKERVEWVKSLRCYGCDVWGGWDRECGPVVNAHTVTGGTSRKANADTIIPLGHKHHHAYDHHEPPFDNPAAREAAKRFAGYIDDAWQAASHQGDRHT